jgi:hypothetical protein
MAKILFWCLLPLFFVVFMRLFFILFYFIYGTVLVYILGKNFSGIITGTAIISSVIFTVATLFVLWKKFKIHILES